LFSENALKVVLFYALFGYAKTIEKFEGLEGAENVIEEFKKRQLEIQADSVAMVDLVARHNLKLREVQHEKLTTDVLCALVKNMTAKEVLEAIPQLWRHDKLKVDVIWKEVAKILEVEEAGSVLYPAEVFVARCDYIKALNKYNYFKRSYFFAHCFGISAKIAHLILSSGRK
jgi:hypothetical protein